MQNPFDEWLDTAEAAEQLGLCQQRIRQLIASGELAALEHRGRWYIHRATLEAFARLRRPVGRPPRSLPPAPLRRKHRKIES